MNAAPRTRLPTITTPSATATTVPAVRNEGRIEVARASSRPPMTTLMMASRARVVGEPIRGITKNGRTNVATMAPVVFTATRAPEDDPSVPVSSPSRAAVAGNVKPITMVGGRTMIAVDHAKSRSASANFADMPLMNGSVGRREDERAAHDQGRGQQLGDGDQADHRLDAGPDEAEQDGADRDPDQEQDQDDREHVGRAAGPGAQQAVPDHLVAERRHARQERQRQREAEPVAWRLRRLGGRDGGGDGSIAGGAGAVTGAGASPTAIGAPARRSRSSATMPAIAEHAAPTSSAPVSPSSSISAKPATAVPTIAPIVFAAYSCWNALPMPAARSTGTG